ncbi:MAG: T9SS type A sorting domain-containing protein [Prolixibacteraceae bacterium]|jgi:hypothetical protein|nr:T9SS type A sorting domain-containing protein [Bacteroidota bacterium]MBT7394804.1 T9SS type A sorting domain-containing protein [Prolixibacteraceae bacterium]
MTTFFIEEGLANGENFTITVVPQNNKATWKLNVESWEKGDESFEEGKISVVGIKEKPIDILEENSGLKLEVFPNPGTDIFYLKILSAFEENATIEIFDYNAKLVYKTIDINLKEGWQQLKIDLSGTTTGVYNVRIKSNQSVGHEKLLIVK